MATIVTNPNYIQVDGARIQKGTRDIIPLENGVRLQNTGSGSVVDILVDGTTIDGVAVADRTELLEYLDSQGFKSGGSGPGTEVSWNDVTDKPTQFTPSAHTHLAADITDLGTAATTDSADYATASQGVLAGTALQPGDLDTKVPDGGTSGQVLKKDASGNNVWSVDANTTYAVITETEFNTGTSSTARAVSAASLNRDINSKLDLRLSAAQRSAIDALVSPEEDYADMAEATAAIKSIIDALKA